MLLDVHDDLSGIPFEMIRIFDECVASAGNCVFGHNVFCIESFYKWKMKLWAAYAFESDGVKWD